MRIGNIEDGGDDVFDILVSHAAVDGKGDFTLVFTGSDRKVLRTVAVGFTVIGVEVQGDEMNAGANVALLQFFDETGAING